MLGNRPTFAWLGYLLLARSPIRFAVVLGGVMMVAVVCIREGRQTMSLKYIQPSKFPPPTVILSTPGTGPLSAFDACGIEAATHYVDVPSFWNVKSVGRLFGSSEAELENLLKTMRNPMDEFSQKRKNETAAHDDHENIEKEIEQINEHSKFVEGRLKHLQDMELIEADEFFPDAKTRYDIETELEDEMFKWDLRNQMRRNVHVYFWSNTIFKEDKWAHFVKKLPGVTMSYINLPRTLARSPLRSWKYREGLTLQSPWISWAVAALSILWNFGGFVMPLGVILTKPLAVTSVGSGMGVIAANDNGIGISSTIIGLPPNHAVLDEMVKKMNMNPEDVLSVQGDGSEGVNAPLDVLKPWETLLTEAVKDGCGTDNVPYLYVSDCGDFTLLPAEEVVGVDSTTVDAQFLTLKTLMYYKGDSKELSDLMYVNRLFHRTGLKQFCPAVTHHLREMASSNGL